MLLSIHLASAVTPQAPIRKMPLSPMDQLHLNTAAGFLRIGEAMDAWNELKSIAPLNRAKTEVLAVRLAVCRALKKRELGEEIARTLVKREPHSVMHVVALAQIMGHREGQLALHRSAPATSVHDGVHLGLRITACCLATSNQ
jgi:hypothetical protein